MLHACLCKCHAGIQKRLLEARASKKMEPQGFQNSMKNQLKSDGASKIVIELPFFWKFVIFRRFVASKIKPKSKKTHLQCDAGKRYTFFGNFNGIFSALASENEAKIQCISHLYRKRRFCKNTCFIEGKLLFFWFGASKNQLKLDAQTQWKITSKKKSRKPNLGVPLGFQNPWKSIPKAM